jgi:amidophosphoribosyltransferase
MPTKAELMASRFSVEEIEKELGVDSLGYLSLEGMEGAVAESGPFCNACFSGNYQAPLVDLDRGLLDPGEAGCC